MSTKKIVVFCWSFLHPSVGGRRWRIFVNYLVDYGCEVTVIALDGPLRDKYIVNEGITFFILPKYNINVVLRKTLAKILPKRYNSSYSSIYSLFLLWRLRKFTINREAHFVATAPPFELASIAVRYFVSCGVPISQIFLDLRDRWAGNSLCFSVSYKANFEAQYLYEFDLINLGVNIVCSHYNDALYYKSKYLYSRVIHTNNPFDENGVQAEPLKHRENNKKIYGLLGSVYRNESGINQVLKGLMKYEFEDDSIILLQDVYYNNYLTQFMRLPRVGHIECFDRADADDYYRKLQSIDYLIVYNTEIMPDNISTKLIDCIQFNIKVLLIADRYSFVTEFVEFNNLGTVIVLDRTSLRWTGDVEVLRLKEDTFNPSNVKRILSL